MTAPDRMQALAEWPATERAAIRGVLTDIDDTLTEDGVISAQALGALHALHCAGLPVIAVTGRPTGWSLPKVLAWPVQAIVAENGAVMLWSSEGAVQRLYRQDEPTRARNQARLQAAARCVMQRVPEARLATDSAGRECDIAFDHSEHHHLEPQQIAQVLQVLAEEGLNATVSSIHINAWLGTHNKLAGARWALQERLSRKLDDELDQWVFVGDSANDALLFEHLPHSVGVANVCEASTLKHWPRYVTEQARGAGFAELAAALLAARGIRASPRDFDHRP